MDQSEAWTHFDSSRGGAGPFDTGDKAYQQVHEKLKRLPRKGTAFQINWAQKKYPKDWNVLET